LTKSDDNEKKLKELDSGRIDFPLDRVSFGQMRQHYPKGFSGVDMWKTPLAFVDLFAAHSIELELAQQAFDKAMGRDAGTSRRAEAISMLNDAYKTYGVATGMHQTRQLIRDLETAARQQAERIRG
jgi:hypothetical protein